eukprot:3633654-Alexandrium_andersonii.AAC.1
MPPGRRLRLHPQVHVAVVHGLAELHHLRHVVAAVRNAPRCHASTGHVEAVVQPVAVPQDPGERAVVGPALHAVALAEGAGQ